MLISHPTCTQHTPYTPTTPHLHPSHPTCTHHTPHVPSTPHLAHEEFTLPPYVLEVEPPRWLWSTPLPSSHHQYHCGYHMHQVVTHVTLWVNHMPPSIPHHPNPSVVHMIIPYEHTTLPSSHLTTLPTSLPPYLHTPPPPYAPITPHMHPSHPTCS
jgi:hypothetical protein